MAISDTNKANEDFWCNIAAESIYGSSERRAKSVDSLKTLITWAFGLFSTGGFAFTLFGNIKDFDGYALINFGIAFFLLTIAYSVANMAQYPVAETYRPSEPVAIANSFSRAVKKQMRIFNVAVGVVSLGFFFFALGLLLQFANVRKNASPKISVTPGLMLNTSVLKKGGTIYIPMTIRAGKNDSVDIKICNNATSKQKDTIPKILFTASLRADSNGMLYYSYSQARADSITSILVEASLRKVTFDTVALQTKTVALVIK